MAVTAGGTPYVESTDLVANYPAASLSLANKVDTKVDYALPVNAQTGTTYTFVLADGLRLTTASNAASSTYTVPPQSSVVWLANSVIRLVNYGTGVVTVAGGSGVTVTNAAKTLAQFESVALIRTGSDAWTLVPFSGGADIDNADFSDAATGTYTENGISYKYITYTGIGTLTVTTAGFAKVLVVSAGGSGGRDGSGSAGGGGGGGYAETEIYLSAGSHTCVIGGGGAGVSTDSQGNKGNSSRFGYIEIEGGGFGGSRNATNNGGAGASGGGATINAANNANGTGGAASTIEPTIGFAGGNGLIGESRGGGGGGASAVGTSVTAGVSGNGGAGKSSDITGTATGRAGGGGGAGSSGGGTATDGGSAGVSSGASNNADANKGGGSGGGLSASGNGGSGVVIIRVRTN